MFAAYPKGLTATLVVTIQQQLTAVPLDSGGWSRRFPYLGHPEALTLVGHHEAELQLRNAGWTGVDFVACPCGDMVPAGTLAPIPGGESDAPHCETCRTAAAESL